MILMDLTFLPVFLPLTSGYSFYLTSDGTNDSFDDWANGLLERLLLVSSSSVWDEDSGLGGLDGDVVSEHLFGGQTLVSVLSVEFWYGVELGFLDIYGSQVACGGKRSKGGTAYQRCPLRREPYFIKINSFADANDLELNTETLLLDFRHFFKCGY